MSAPSAFASRNVLEHEPRVVGEAVVVLEDAAEVVGREAGLEPERLLAAIRAVDLRHAEERERVVEPEARVELGEPVRLAAVDRHQERDRPDEMRRHLHLDGALGRPSNTSFSSNCSR
jgi:hypothetical protein